MATDERTPDLAPAAPAAPPSVPTGVVVGGSALLGAGVVGASLAGDFALLFALLVAGALAVTAVFMGFRSFTHFFVLACCLRPLIDLTAGPRSSGISLTELFGVAVLGVMLVWLAMHRRELARRITTPLALSLLAMVAVYALATLGSAAPGDGFSATLRMAAGVAVFLVTDLVLVTGRLTLRQILQLVFLVSLIPLLYPFLGLVGVEVTHEKDGITALKSVFFLSNNLAHFLVPLLVLGVAWALRTRGWHRVAAVSYVAVVGIELVLSQTRGAWIGAAVGVLIVCLLLDRRIALVGVVAVVVAAISVPAINSRIADLAPNPDEPYSESSFAWRLGQWERLLPEVTESPVLGGGPGESVRLTAKEPHNDYLKAALETGLLGFGAYLWFLGAAALTSWRAYLRVRRARKKRPGSPAAAPLVQATFAGIAAYSIAVMFGAAGENLIDNVTFLWATLPLFAIAQWALTARLRRLRFEEEP